MRKIPVNDDEIEMEFGDARNARRSNRNLHLREEEDERGLLRSSDGSYSSDDDASSSGSDSSYYYGTEDDEPNAIVSCFASFCARLQYIYIYQRTECVLFFILMICISLFLTGIIEEIEGGHPMHRNKRPVMHDWSEIQSKMELKIGSIDHWCFDGTNDNCPKCDDPLEGIPRIADRGWLQAFKKNAHSSRAFYNLHPYSHDLDIAFLGDSLTEARVGTTMGVDDSNLKEIKNTFLSQFDKETHEANPYQAIALGIDGDTSPNLLWRITQHEIPETLNPKIWWITIGMNDMKSTSCSEDITLMGILRIVEELLKTRPGSSIVINGLLPIATSKSAILNGQFVKNPYWPSIQKINESLEKFAKKHETDGVYYFNPDDIFTSTKRGRTKMRKDLFRDRYHPNADGYKLWGDAQLKTISTIMRKREVTHVKNPSDYSNGPTTVEKGSIEDTFGNIDDGYSVGGDDDDDFF